MLDQPVDCSTAEHRIWLTAYVWALQSMDPENAEKRAGDAAQRYVAMRERLFRPALNDLTDFYEVRAAIATEDRKERAPMGTADRKSMPASEGG
jgi:hypothetical protein